jgi:hypothetical protein
MEFEFVNECFRWEIQSPSGTGRRTDFEGGVCARLFWPVEEVRGGIALGERRVSLCGWGWEGMVEGPP